MALNIKNERVCDLARQAADATGRTQTGAIELALEELLHSKGLDVGAARARMVIDRVSSLALAYCEDPGGSERSILIAEDLYDDATGLLR